jgi:transposase-like protein
MICKLCGSSVLIKNGKELGVQRYKCKDCNKTFKMGDARLKYSLEKRIKVLKMYLEGMGIRSIERLEKVSGALVVYWIRYFSKMVCKELKRSVPQKVEDVEIVELDELFTYYKKRPTEHMCGLLLTETGTKLLISR